jgi:hypothetical protein
MTNPTETIQQWQARLRQQLDEERLENEREERERRAELAERAKRALAGKRAALAGRRRLAHLAQRWASRWVVVPVGRKPPNAARASHDS